MSQHDLREQLDQLAAEIDRLAIDDRRKAELQTLVERVEQQLQSDSDEPRDLREQLEEAMSQFEAEHPTFTGVLHRVLMTLSSMGV